MSKKILINEQSIDIIDYSVQRSRLDGHLTLTVKVPMENISAGDLVTLVNYIKTDAPAIVVYEDDKAVQTLTGFKLTPFFALAKDGLTWELSIENSSELEFQYGLLKQRADNLERLNADQALVIASQGEQITLQNEVIRNQEQRISDQDILIESQGHKIESQDKIIEDQNATIASQGEQIADQAEQIALQAEEMILLNDTLLEMLMG